MRRDFVEDRSRLADGIQQLQKKEGSIATKPAGDACSYAMKKTAEGFDEFKSLKGLDRFAHRERFCIDPSTAGLKRPATKTTSVARSEQQGWQFADLTAKQLGGSWQEFPSVFLCNTYRESQSCIPAN